MVRNVNAGAALIDAPQQISQRTVNGIDRDLDEAITQRAPNVALNLSATQIIDSAGLNWLLNAQSRLAASNITLHLVAVPPIVVDILLATRLDSRFTVSALEEVMRA
ncbi:MAG TPA: STAS domain-containing protein [Phycisphaerae bacterium]|nr:STAS domain-containing protein [Phycisphaerae bacterium]